jgi:hypothetical protein
MKLSSASDSEETLSGDAERVERGDGGASADMVFLTL